MSLRELHDRGPVMTGRPPDDPRVLAPVEVLLSWSGGKDSALTLRALAADPRHLVVGLVTSITRPYDRVSIHGVRRTLLEAQAAALGLPVLEVSIDAQCSNAAYESAFVDTLERAAVRFPRCRTIAFGDLFLADVRRYRERLLARTGYAPVFPLWGRDTTTLANEFIDAGYAATVVCVDTTQLSPAFAGRLFDATLLADLPDGVDPCGERGEFHTFVARGPIFRTEVRFESGEVTIRDGRFAYCDLRPTENSRDQATA